MKRLLPAIVICFFSITLNAQNVNIPDANFKAYLVGNAAINTNADSEIQVSEAAAFTGTIDCSSLNISDLTGIEAFTALTQLSCAQNQLTSLDVSNNTNLQDLRCNNNPFSTSLDVSNNTALNILYCFGNQLTSLDVSNNTALTHLWCYSNQLTSLDVSNNTNLEWLNLRNNQITAIDVSTNTALELLYTYDNPITSLDVSNNIALTSLFCHNSLLSTLDVSNNTSLVNLFCFNNQLTELNVANGNNTNFVQFNATTNPGLSCIYVDDVAYSEANWTDIDGTTSFCCLLNIPDANFKTVLVNDDAIDTDFDDEISCAEAEAFTGTINCTGQFISDLTGIEAFTNMTFLNCVGNQLTSLDLSANAEMLFVYCYSNDLTSLNLNGAVKLRQLYCYDNLLTTLDVSNNPALQVLRCNDNDLSTLDVSNNAQLSSLRCHANGMSTLTLHASTNTTLTDLQCYDNNLTSIDVSNHPDLEGLHCYRNSFTSLDISVNTKLVTLFCGENTLGSIDLSTNTNLEYLSVVQSGLTELDASMLTSLKELRCYNNQIDTLDLSNASLLTFLDCQNNALESLNVANGNNTNVTDFDATGNTPLTCIQVDDSTYSANNWTNIDGTAHFSEDCYYITGLSGNVIPAGVSIYPVPASDVITVSGLPSLKQLILVNTLGKTEVVSKNSTIAVRQLPAGIYVLKVIYNSGAFSKPIVIE